MDKKKAQEILQNSTFEEFMQAEDITKEKEQSDFVATDAIAGFPCREVFEVMDDGNIIKKVEFEALREDSQEKLPESIKENLRKLQESKTQIIKADDLLQDSHSASEVEAYKSQTKSDKKLDELKTILKEAIEQGDAGEAEPILIDVYEALQSNNVKVVPNNTNMQVDATRASSSNKIYTRSRDEWDDYYDEWDEEYYQRAQLREMGIPFDETINRDAAICASLSFIASCATVGGLWAIYAGSTPLIAVAGVTGYLGIKYVERKLDLNYRKAVKDLQDTYFRSRGGLTKEAVKEIMMVNDFKLPDKYALACMTAEEREAILATVPQQPSKKELRRRIHKALYKFELQELKRIQKMKRDGVYGVKVTIKSDDIEK